MKKRRFKIRFRSWRESKEIVKIETFRFSSKDEKGLEKQEMLQDKRHK